MQHTTRLAFVMIFLNVSSTSAFAQSKRGDDATDSPSVLSSRPSADVKTRTTLTADDSLAPTPSETSWWSTKGMRHSIGVELSDASYGALGTTAIAYGYSRDKFGIDLYMGYSKEQDTAATTSTTSTNDAATPKTKTVSQEFSGVKKPKQTTFGIQPKFYFFSDRWFKASVGFMIARTSSSAVKYNTGTTTTTYADSSNLNNYTVSQTDYGTVSQKSSDKTLYGPRLNTEFYLKWFPHIALGFGTGLIMSTGADATATSSTSNKTYAVTNGTAANPTVDQTESAEQKTPSGGTAKTLALGGSTFSLLGSFTVRYIW
jgi:hypothetical protein